MKQVHAIFIDAEKREIRAVFLGEDQLWSACDLIGCDMIEAAIRLSNDDVLYVEEEALVKKNRPKYGFSFRGHYYHGNGLIVNEPPEEEDLETPCSSIMSLLREISFKVRNPVTMVDVILAFTDGRFRMMTELEVSSFKAFPKESLICYDFGDELLTVVICPGEGMNLRVLTLKPKDLEPDGEPGL